jgi:hypothetical protein
MHTAQMLTEIANVDRAAANELRPRVEPMPVENALDRLEKVHVNFPSFQEPLVFTIGPRGGIKSLQARHRAQSQLRPTIHAPGWRPLFIGLDNRAPRFRLRCAG